MSSSTGQLWAPYSAGRQPTAPLCVRPGLLPAGPGASGSLSQALSSGHAAQDLAEFTFKLRQPGSPEYEGVDTSLDVSLRWAGGWEEGAVAWRWSGVLVSFRQHIFQATDLSGNISFRQHIFQATYLSGNISFRQLSC